MNGKWLSIAILIVVATILLIASSCAHNQHLTSITVQPSSGTFGAVDPSAFFNLKAFGTYVHPPQTKDITNQVTWQSDNPQVVQVTSSGVASPNTNCGRADIFATFNDGGNLVTSNSSTITVDGPAAAGCTPAGAQPTLTVDFAGAGAGNVSSPSGISCSSPTSCSNTFALGSTIVLTATATGTSTFAGWSGCTSTSGTSGEVCTVSLQNNVTVTVTFN